MKKVIVTLSLGVLIPLMGVSQTTLGPGTTGTSLSVAGLPHNFSSQTWNPYQNVGLGGQICQPCHTPHNSNFAQVTEAPLWNHTLTTASFQMYVGTGSFGLNGGGYGLTAPDGTSKLCLSCHDGSVALGAFGGQTGSTTMTGYDNGNADLGTDLRNDHPVSFVYDSVIAGGVHTPTYIYKLFDGTSSGKAVSKLLDINGKVQCTSCHGPHSNSKGYQLSMSNQNSALCLACHKK